MDIRINCCLEGAIKAQGITVVIDVFRASNTIISCLSNRVDFVIPVGEIDDAFELKRENENYLLLGERGGVMIEGFDYGNSPIEVSKMGFRNKKVILTTSAGSQGIVYSNNADEIIIGSFANANAIVEYLRLKNPEIVTFLAIGNEAKELAVEDYECAKYLNAKLLGEEADFDVVENAILVSDGASRLKRLKQEDDLEYCLKLNISNIVPMFNRDTNRITKI